MRFRRAQAEADARPRLSPKRLPDGITACASSWADRSPKGKPIGKVSPSPSSLIPLKRLWEATHASAPTPLGLEAAVGEEAWDVVHAQHWMSAMATRAACERLPMVVTIRDYWPVCIWSTMLSGTSACPGCSYTRRVVCVGRRRPWMWPIAPASSLVRERGARAPSASARRRQSHRRRERARSRVRSRSTTSTSSPTSCPTELSSKKRPPSRRGRMTFPSVTCSSSASSSPTKPRTGSCRLWKRAGTDVPLVVAGTGSLSERLERRRETPRTSTCAGWVGSPMSVCSR